MWRLQQFYTRQVGAAPQDLVAVETSDWKESRIVGGIERPAATATPEEVAKALPTGWAAAETPPELTTYPTEPSRIPDPTLAPQPLTTTAPQHAPVSSYTPISCSPKTTVNDNQLGLSIKARQPSPVIDLCTVYQAAMAANIVDSLNSEMDLSRTEATAITEVSRWRQYLQPLDYL